MTRSTSNARATGKIGGKTAAAPRRFFVAGREAEEADLRAHLVDALGDGPELGRALFDLDFACEVAAGHRELAADADWQQTRKLENRQRHAHHKTVARLAAELRERLATERPEFASEGIDWVQFEAQLSRVENAAATEAAASGPKRPGRPPLWWRDNLVAIAFECYPAGSALKTVDSHFEQTVEMLFGFIEHDIANVHDVVVDALGRQPRPSWWLRETIDDLRLKWENSSRTS